MSNASFRRSSSNPNPQICGGWCSTPCPLLENNTNIDEPRLTNLYTQANHSQFFPPPKNITQYYPYVVYELGFTDRPSSEETFVTIGNLLPNGPGVPNSSALVPGTTYRLRLITYSKIDPLAVYGSPRFAISAPLIITTPLFPVSSSSSSIAAAAAGAAIGIVLVIVIIGALLFRRRQAKTKQSQSTNQPMLYAADPFVTSEQDKYQLIRASYGASEGTFYDDVTNPSTVTSLTPLL